MAKLNFTDYFRNAGPGRPGRAAKGTDPRTALKQAVRPRILAWITGGSDRKTFRPAPFDWEQIDKMAATDTYVFQGILKYQELLWKEGYDLKGAVPESLVYIQQRLKVLGLAMDQGWDAFLREVGDNLVKYHNCFIAKVRNPEVGKLAGLNIKGLDGKDPIAGYFIIPTKTVSIQQDEFGRVTKYRQTVAGGAKPIDFAPEDIIHITHARPSGTKWGVPFLDAALEDVRSFRIIEEDMLTIVHSEIYPLLHYAVNGNKPEWPVDDDDITNAYSELEDMKSNGAIVTKGADTLEILGADGKALDVSPYINHFKERAIASLGLAKQHLGMGTSDKVDPNRVDAGLYDKIKNYQYTLEDVITNHIFFELLIEGGFDPLSAQKNGKGDPTVFFSFKEIDVDAQIKRNNHISVLWLQNMITHGEMRAQLGLVVDPANAEKYHIDMIEAPLAELSKAVTGPEGGANPNSPAKGTPKSQNNPANDKGNRGGPKVQRAADAWKRLERSAVDLMLMADELDADTYAGQVVNELCEQAGELNLPWLKRDLELLMRHAIDATTEVGSRVALVRASFRALAPRVYARAK